MEIKTKTVKVLIEVDINYTSEKALQTALNHISNTHDPYLCYSSVLMEGKSFTKDFTDAYSLMPHKGYKLVYTYNDMKENEQQ